MKKRLLWLLSVVFCFVLCVSLVACGGDNIKKLTDISRFSSMTIDGTDRIDVEFDNNTGSSFDFSITEEDTICDVMDIVINAEVYAKDGDLWAGDNTSITIVQGSNEYHLSVRANKENGTFYYFENSDLQDKINELARLAGAYEPENPFADFSSFANEIISGLKERGYTPTKEYTSKVSFTKGNVLSTVNADFFDEKSLVQNRVNGVSLSCGRYAFTNTDSIYKEICGALLENLGVVASNGEVEIDNILATYSEESKQSDIFTNNGYVYFLIFNETGEYNSFLSTWLPNFEFRVFNVDSINTYFNSIDESQYTQLTSNHINQPTIYASTKVHFLGVVQSIRDIDSVDSYLIGKIITMQVGEITCEIWYDYAYYPFTFTVGDSFEVYGSIDNFGDVMNISAKNAS